jgi:cellulose synthase/poly-beta-1,6-N-acetylglucosamine synthase-like glycosyltransferase
MFKGFLVLFFMALFVCISLSFWILYIASLWYDPYKYRYGKLGWGVHLSSLGTQDLKRLDYLAVVPAHNESFVIGSTVRKLFDTGFNTVLVACDACIDDTKQEALKNHAIAIDVSFHNKDKALKSALSSYCEIANNVPRGVFVFDADTVPSKNFLLKALPYLSDHLLQFRFYNKNNNSIISRSVNLITIIFFGIQRGLMVLLGYGALGGTVTYIPNENAVLYDYLLINLDVITEDLANTVYMKKMGHKVYFIDDPEIFAYNETVSDFYALFRQRLRWSRGYFQMLAYHFRDLVSVPLFLWFSFFGIFASISCILVLFRFSGYYLYALVIYVPLLLAFLKRPDRLGLRAYLLFPLTVWVCSFSCLVAAFTYSDMTWITTKHNVVEVVK